MSNSLPTSDAVQLFLKSWQVYQNIIANNYMFHREITQATNNALLDFAPDRKISVLDLGCGDASMALPLLQADRIGLYTGCDLSDAALNIAQIQLDSRQITHHLLCEDMCQTVAEQPQHSIDIVFSSYAIHHLDTASKEGIIRNIARVLKPDGLFVLIDIFREPNESHDDYMRHYMAELKKSWVKLSTDEQTLVVNHATNYDFPETTDFYETLCRKSGFQSAQRLSKHTWHEAWVYAVSH